MFTKSDLLQIEKKGITLNQVKSQIALFKKGPPFAHIESAATINSGITPLKSLNIEALINYFDTNINTIKAVKFIPASGAATRMFKFLFQFLKNYTIESKTIDTYLRNNHNPNLELFVENFDKLPFYKEVIDSVNKSYGDYKKLDLSQKVLLFVKTMIEKDKLNFGSQPKGLLPFHKYKTHLATAFEEHLLESVLYAASNNKANLHFTISKKHEEKFKEILKTTLKDIEHKTKTTFTIDFSFQKKSTDTIAVSKEYQPIRNTDNKLVFRPAGHGALIENLNAIDADIIFIKNIDNVVVVDYHKEMAKYKKVLAAILLQTQQKAFEYAKHLDDSMSQEHIDTIRTFLENELNVVVTSDFQNFSFENQKAYLKKQINRPIRVCGMVKNEGEPGGGPFWVKDNKGNRSLQIIESAQIDKSNNKQKAIFKQSTHFNPVDIVCGVKNYKGEKYNLTQFVDNDAVFISKKSIQGKELLALELPGLWNGAMANWNTVFVEVPMVTFSPVKTVNDLLKPAHQVI